MREEVKQMFNKRDLELHKLVQKCPYGFNDRQIAVAMEQVYDRVRSGEKIRPIRFGWEVWNQAKKNTADSDVDIPTRQELDEIQGKNVELVVQVGALSEIAEKLNKNVYRLSIYLYISLCLNIAMTGAWFWFYGRAYL